MALRTSDLETAPEPCTEWRVVHELPTRTRFRLACPAPRQTAATAVERAVQAVPGVHRAEFSVETGSLLVLHDAQDATRFALRRALGALRFEHLPCAPGEQERCRQARNGVVRDAVLSFITAALPPAPRAALQLVQSLRSAR